jgi:hypothetical protein
VLNECTDTASISKRVVQICFKMFTIGSSHCSGHYFPVRINGILGRLIHPIKQVLKTFSVLSQQCSKSRLTAYDVNAKNPTSQPVYVFSKACPEPFVFKLIVL